MSTRERWIVYPLLFLTLGIAMRNQFLPTKRMGAVDFMAGELSAQTIRCDNLEVRQDEQCNNLHFNGATGDHLTVNYAQSNHSRSGEAEFRQLAVTDEQTKPVIIMQENQNTKSGVIQTMTADGAPQVLIHSNGASGVVAAIGHMGQVVVEMGHEGNAYGVFAQTLQGGPPFMLTPPKFYQAAPAVPKLSPTPMPNTPPVEKNNEAKKEKPKTEESKPER
jgi:hypothetical protein